MRTFLTKIGLTMQIPTWTKPGLLGAGVGAIALAILGFNWGGWVTGSTASKMTDTVSTAAVAAALTSYCVLNAKNDPASTAVMAEIADASSYKRRAMVEEAGWATPLGSEEPDRALAESCLTALSPST